MEGEDRDGYRDQIVTCDVCVSLHSPLFMKYSNHRGRNPIKVGGGGGGAFAPPPHPLLLPPGHGTT